MPAPATPMIGIGIDNLPKVFGLHPIQHMLIRFNGAAAASLVDQVIFICPVGQSYQVVAVDEVHATAGSDASAVSLQVTKDTGTNAPGAGTDLLTNNTNVGFDMKGTANTVQNGTLTATTASLVFVAGDRLSDRLRGHLTALAGVNVTIPLKRLS
jgi:hypothetical protein